MMDTKADIKENVIKAVNEGKIPLSSIKNIGFNVAEEMQQRNIAIPDQDIISIRFYRQYAERIMLRRGTRELLKFLTKDQVEVLFKHVKHFFEGRPIGKVQDTIEKPTKDAEHERRYKTDVFYRQGVDESKAELRAGIIEGVHDGKLGLRFAEYMGFDIKEEMIERDISIPDQDLLDVEFYKNRLAWSVFDAGVRKLLKIFTQEEIADYLELVRTNTDDDYLKKFPEHSSEAVNEDSEGNEDSEEDDDDYENDDDYEEDDEEVEFCFSLQRHTLEELDQLFEDIGITFDDALNIFCEKALAVRGFPFDVRISDSH